LGISSEPGKF